MSSDCYGNLLSSVLVNKLPQEMQLVLSRKVGDDDWKLEALMEVLEQEVKAREQTKMNPPATVKKPSKEQHTAAALLSRSSNSGPLYCYYQKAHSSNACRTGSIQTRQFCCRQLELCSLTQNHHRIHWRLELFWIAAANDLTSRIVPGKNSHSPQMVNSVCLL